jgi:hypothetical protein
MCTMLNLRTPRVLRGEFLHCTTEDMGGTEEIEKAGAADATYIS